MIYRLTPVGRALYWKSWKKLGGCSLANGDMAMVCRYLGIERTWDKTTLGDIADVWAPAERTLARFSVEHLGRKDLSEPEPGV